MCKQPWKIQADNGLREWRKNAQAPSQKPECYIPSSFLGLNVASSSHLTEVLFSWFSRGSFSNLGVILMWSWDGVSTVVTYSALLTLRASFYFSLFLAFTPTNQSLYLLNISPSYPRLPTVYFQAHPPLIVSNLDDHRASRLAPGHGTCLPPTCSTHFLEPSSSRQIMAGNSDAASASWLPRAWKGSSCLFSCAWLNCRSSPK